MWTFYKHFKKVLTTNNVCDIILPLRKNAPLAQLVEQLTLNQWVRGSSPRRCTKYFDYVSYILEVVFKSYRKATSTLPPVASPVGVFNAQGPPVPIPNTEVKLCGAEDTCLATSRENRSMPTFFRFYLIDYSELVQLAGGPRKTIKYCFSTGVN